MKTLKMNYEFKNVLEKGKYFIGSQVVVYVLKTNNNENRYGIAISSKVCNAVRRNYIKRLIRESFRMFKDELKTPFDIVIMWNKKADINSVSYKEIYNNIENALSKAGILNDEKNNTSFN